MALDNNFEDLTFTKVSDLKTSSRSERDVQKEIFKKVDPTKIVDEYERKVLGLGNKATNKKNLKYKNRVFSPEDEEDRDLLNELFNNPKYSVVYMKDNWTVNGNYKTFIIYTEDLDYKE